MNRDLLMNNMGVSRATADPFLNNNAISPTTQTILIAALGQLGIIPGQAEFIRRAATSQDEHDAIAFQQSAQLMVNLNRSKSVVRITELKGLTVCQTNGGGVVVPIQWDYVVWTANRAVRCCAQGSEIHQSGRQLFCHLDRRRLAAGWSGPFPRQE